ncbi:DUF726-domain-containing protein [Aureobasidium melanogenum CBS 110374]|uniref:DUF726-domain-containing protein n=1 Tax=Aureobasidium melanogenum (strain CBS 110374) TaxID=1043003 RepID=A0A074VSA2_AURM1|nr:DUF726-domain-containing protein [Aureobasidium melanogenum CBS 110374]KEQ60587.1 DUF726-domain-containing protein [Aureobasidium melanogenum CBS 110374]
MFSKLPWSSGGEQQQQHEEEQSLTSVLPTPQARSDLTLLVANCTETMRKGITDTFDLNQIGKMEDMMSKLKVDESAQNSDPAATPEKTEEEKKRAEEKAQREQAERERELSGPKMQELQKAALQHFDDWRDSVLLRIGEVVNQREEAVSQKKEAHAQTPRVPSKKAPEPSKYDEGVSKALKELCPPTETPLVELEEEHRALILHSVLLLLLSLEHYSAHSRVLLLHLTSSLNLSIGFLADDESKIARGLLSAAEMKADDETKKKQEDNKESRKWKVGLASVAGAALIGVTGGLAAPLVAAGIGSVMGGLGLGATAAAGYLGTLASSSIIVGGLFGAYGGRMTGQMMDQYAKEVEDFSFVPVRTYHKPRKIEKEYRRLRVAIGISGWLTEKDEVVEPWKVIGPEMEAFALRFELQALLNLGNSLTTMIRSAAWGYAKSEIIKRTVFASLTAALWPLGLLKVSRIIDNPFSVAKSRADKAGEVLADALINRAQGERPVTLIGYSLGARVIFTCLKSLAARKAFGLVENVVLLGAPTPSTAADWRLIRAVTTGRVVNVYSTSDYILGFLYRSSSIQYGVAGLEPVSYVPGVQNVDVTDLIAGNHTSYRYLCGRILRKIGFEDVDLAAVEQEEKALEQATEAEEEERKQNEASTKEGATTEAEVKEMESEVQKKNEASMMDWATEKFRAGGASATSAASQAKEWVQRNVNPRSGGQNASNDVGGAAGAVGSSLI